MVRNQIFQVGKPASGNHFVGRENEVRIISQLLAMGQSIVLIAPRRFGKTSLVLEILRRIKSSEVYTAYVDVFASPTLELLSAQIVEAVLKNHKLDKLFTKSRNSALAMMKNLKLKAVLEDFEFILGFTDTSLNEWGMLQDSIQFIDRFPVKHRKKMICVFDEFGDVNKLDGDKIVKLFRSGIQNHSNATYIFSGSYESVMNSIFVRKNSPFFRFARIINLDFIDKRKFIPYFMKISEAFDVQVNSSAVENVLDFTEGHPYYSQLALQTIIVQYKLTDEVPDLDFLKENLLHTERGYLEKTWEDIAPGKENVKVLLALAQSEKHIYSMLREQGINVYRGLINLMNKGIILKGKEGGYKFSDPLFKYWLRKNVIKGIDSH